MPSERWAGCGTAELVLTTKVRVSRRLATTSTTDKGKIFLDLAGGATITRALPGH